MLMVLLRLLKRVLLRMKLKTSRLSLKLRVLRLLLNNSNLFMIEIGRGVAFATPLFFME